MLPSQVQSGAFSANSPSADKSVQSLISGYRDAGKSYREGKQGVCLNVKNKNKGGKMPRYFFDMVSQSARANDKKGYELPCASDAYVYARRIAREARRYLSEKDGRWVIRIHSSDEDFDLIVLFPPAGAAANSNLWWGHRHSS